MSNIATGSVPSIAATPAGGASSGPSRLANVAVIAGVVAFVGAALLLWAREGATVFATALLSGLSACL